MKQMKKFLGISLMMMLATVFLAAGAVEAKSYPDWVTVKYTGASLKTQKNTKATDGNHRSLVLKYDIINNSKRGDIITAIYNRKLRWNGTFTVPSLGGKNQWSVKGGGTGTKPVKGEWYPGQVYKYQLVVPLNKILDPTYKQGMSATQWYDWGTFNNAIKKGSKFKMAQWDLDFQVSSRK